MEGREEEQKGVGKGDEGEAQEQAQLLESLNQERRGLQEGCKKQILAMESEFYRLAERNRKMRFENTIESEGGGPVAKKQRLS